MEASLQFIMSRLENRDEALVSLTILVRDEPGHYRQTRLFEERIRMADLRPSQTLESWAFPILAGMSDQVIAALCANLDKGKVTMVQDLPHH